MGSVLFSLDDGAVVHMENTAPYTLTASDLEGGRIAVPWTIPLGKHTLVVTPYSGSNKTGRKGANLVIAFEGKS